MERAAGILLPVFSLPSPHGIGTLGRDARAFADFLAQAGQRWWQILPLCPAGSGNSPYLSVSSHAGDPALIDLDLLKEAGLLRAEEIETAPDGPAGAVDYGQVYESRARLLRLACERLWARERSAVEEFSAKRPWAEDYALYQAARTRFSGKSWRDWPDAALRDHETAAVARWRQTLASEVSLHLCTQFLFDRQWRALRAYAHGRGVQILGDLPMYVSLDSADVWAERGQFLLDGAGRPTAVAGVPPDYFSEEGQLWGNPLYNWAHMKADGYGWWIRRAARAGEQFDAVRIDHFRAFASYWAIPPAARTAQAGRWETGPGMELLSVLKDWFPKIRWIAEDLGAQTEDVAALLRAAGLPGMRVLEFAFSGPDNAYLPHNCEKSCVLYTGTHDNAPLAAWIAGAEEGELAYAKRYLGADTPDALRRALLRAGQGSVANLFIAQMQDYLGDTGRINVPGTPEGNWRWRLRPGALGDDLADEIFRLTRDFGRCSARNG